MWQSEETAHLPLSEQFQTIWNQARLEAIAKDAENPDQKITLSEIRPSNMSKIYPSIQDIANQEMQKQQFHTQFAQYFKHLIESLLSKDQETNARPVCKTTFTSQHLF